MTTVQREDIIPTRWTVILGENGAGKTSILEKLAKEHAGEPNQELYLVTYKSTRKSYAELSRQIDDEFINIQDYLSKLDYAAKSGRPKARERLLQIVAILKKVLPDIEDIHFIFESDDENKILAKTKYGDVDLRELSYGYQTVLALIVDLASKMIKKYPESENPLDEPAIVLIDEIDLHLHPSWQQKIIGLVDQFFKGTQFIVTTHSPLVVQSCERCNLVILHKEADGIHIENRIDVSYQGWTVDEILQELMGMESTRSEQFLQIKGTFAKAIEDENQESAQYAYEKIKTIIHPTSRLRDLMKIELDLLDANKEITDSDEDRA